MGLMDTVKEWFGGHPDKADTAVDKAAGTADEKTGGKHTDQIQTGADKAKEGLGSAGGGEQPEPPAQEQTPPPA